MTRRRAPRPVGRPPIASTRWLAERLCDGGDPWRHFGRWNKLHRECMGYPCRDARRSFRKALASARKLLAHE